MASLIRHPWILQAVAGTGKTPSYPAAQLIRFLHIEPSPPPQAAPATTANQSAVNAAASGSTVGDGAEPAAAPAAPQQPVFALGELSDNVFSVKSVFTPEAIEMHTSKHQKPLAQIKGCVMHINKFRIVLNSTKTDVILIVDEFNFVGSEGCHQFVPSLQSLLGNPDAIAALTEIKAGVEAGSRGILVFQNAPKLAQLPSLQSAPKQPAAPPRQVEEVLTWVTRAMPAWNPSLTIRPPSPRLAFPPTSAHANGAGDSAQPITSSTSRQVLSFAEFVIPADQEELLNTLPGWETRPVDALSEEFTPAGAHSHFTQYPADPPYQRMQASQAYSLASQVPRLDGVGANDAGTEKFGMDDWTHSQLASAFPLTTHSEEDVVKLANPELIAVTDLPPDTGDYPALEMYIPSPPPADADGSNNPPAEGADQPTAMQIEPSATTTTTTTTTSAATAITEHAPVDDDEPPAHTLTSEPLPTSTIAENASSRNVENDNASTGDTDAPGQPTLAQTATDAENNMVENDSSRSVENESAVPNDVPGHQSPPKSPAQEADNESQPKWPKSAFGEGVAFVPDSTDNSMEDFDEDSFTSPDIAGEAVESRRSAPRKYLPLAGLIPRQPDRQVTVNIDSNLFALSTVQTDDESALETELPPNESASARAVVTSTGGTKTPDAAAAPPQPKETPHLFSPNPKSLATLASKQTAPSTPSPTTVAATLQPTPKGAHSERVAIDSPTSPTFAASRRSLPSLSATGPAKNAHPGRDQPVASPSIARRWSSAASSSSPSPSVPAGQPMKRIRLDGEASSPALAGDNTIDAQPPSPLQTTSINGFVVLPPLPAVLAHRHRQLLHERQLDEQRKSRAAGDPLTPDDLAYYRAQSIALGVFDAPLGASVFEAIDYMHW
ncbi:hypothetical protein CAOG_05591 [Capsaspora owczarzaki ATCC 30864]|uniref:hypothetical protein n=1 Tax=Capsaspora owczarzaki (strain ATCC 30864) TaxID=595528 RepID=UPI0001FE4ADD|nr:hypothetical protein CAOG_05591 [Capsaspora owczarzaki ATCC 30864]|eukprot:XP_004346264.1 hypothetical protein CAOG_05591 [Capsaspora owczarzaki ATCC 30864]